MLDVQNVSHWFGDRQVLDQISFAIETKEILVIMGASGGGKTTLLRCINGLIVPTEGDILVDDVSVRKNADSVRQKMGFVFQYAALFDYLNVEENVAFGLRRKPGIKRNSIPETVATMLKLVGLEGAEKLMPSELSGGMRKRVGLARALAMEPSYVLYDEPTSGLDPVTAYSIDRLIVETRDEVGVTSIVVSHDLSSVLRVADKIAFLDGGKLAFFGTPAEFRKERRESIDELVEKARAESFLESAQAERP
ncbi:MAG: ATP-binding cassette domain-containing protein [Armatimonadetes bacterium]|nr:ATP-binding cassette domain-containing protein [Armatimonadota bacterium]